MQSGDPLLRQASGALLDSLVAQAPPPRIDHLVQAQARRTPDAIALQFGQETWTYAELESRAEHLADLLHEAGVQPRMLVGLCVHRSMDMVAGALAVLKAGCAYLPIDPALPPVRLDLILEDAQPEAILATQALAHVVSKLDVTIVHFDQPRVTSGLIRREIESAPEDVAYVLYTSGSTGRPKGVEIGHAGTVNFLNAMRRNPGFSVRDVTLAITTLSFDIAVLELFLPLITGGHAVILSSADAADPAALTNHIATSGCTVLQATPATWRVLLEAGWKGKAGLRALCGGEAMTRDLADRLLERCDALWNLYGPTETTVWCSVHQVQPGSGPIPIGPPIDRATLHVMDEDRRPTPEGEIGELYIAGAGLALGYRGRPDLTAERFVYCDAVPLERLYRTGDLVRRRADGLLDYLGRSDDQVKVRGHRIELGDVEAALLAQDGVAWAAVRAWPDQVGDRRLVAYVVNRAGSQPEPAALRRNLRGLLPEYMIPRRIVPMASLPMTPNGKIDRNALLEPPPETLTEDLTDETELALASIWSEILDVSDISPTDNFFNLGGYSLLTVRMLKQVDAVFGQRLSMADLFQTTDLRSLASRIRDGVSYCPTGVSYHQTGVIPLQPSGSRTPLFWLDAGPLLRPLAAAIGREQPILGVNVTAEEEQELGDAFAVEDVARLLVRTVRTAQPQGPYYLGGWCRWGLVAYEAASQLTRQGEAVGLVILLDTANRSAAPKRSLSDFLLRARERLVRPPRRNPEDVEQADSSLSLRVDHACDDYQPPAYRGNVALFHAADGRRWPAPGLGWKGLVQGTLICRSTPGDHRSVLTSPNVDTLGPAMEQCLWAAQSPPRQTRGW
jgi:amino acid adenylation domain-containing protein